MAAIAATTRRIRIGSAGIMLPHYSALKVAEQFRRTDAIAAGPHRPRRGAGARLGRPHRACLESAFQCRGGLPRQVQELQHWVSGTALPTGHPYRGIAALPTSSTTPQIWILGSSNYGAQLAAHLGLPYAYAYFFTEGAGVEEALDLYRRHYRPSTLHPKPLATICVWALAADSEHEARRLLKTREFWRAGFEKGQRQPLASPEDAGSASLQRC